MKSPDLAYLTVDYLVEKTRTVYSLPFFYEKLNEAINHPRMSITDIAEIITEDQGLTARILRLANSPLFGYFSKVETITRAVTIVGTQQLRDLALASSVIKIFQGIPEELMSMTSFWQHSVACGIIARNLASCLMEPNLERYFVSGILHDVGQLVLCSTVPELLMRIEKTAEEQNLSFDMAEWDVLGFDHTEIAGSLFRTWKIPESIIELVSCHHKPEAATQFPRETAVIHIADIVCQAMQFGHSAERTVSELKDQAWQQLGIPISTIATIIKQSEPHIMETFGILAEAG